GFDFGQLILGLFDELWRSFGDVRLVAQTALECGAEFGQLIAAFGEPLFFGVSVGEVVGVDIATGGAAAGAIGGTLQIGGNLQQFAGGEIFDERFIGEDLTSRVAGGGDGDSNRRARVDLVFV